MELASPAFNHTHQQPLLKYAVDKPPNPWQHKSIIAAAPLLACVIRWLFFALIHPLSGLEVTT